MRACFKAGDLVAQDHRLPGLVGAGGSVLESALPEAAPRGTVVGPANAENTWYEVEFADGNRTLTFEELVKVRVE